MQTPFSLSNRRLHQDEYEYRYAENEHEYDSFGLTDTAIPSIEILEVSPIPRYAFLQSNIPNFLDIPNMATEPTFDHDRLDVYRLAIEYVAESFSYAKQLSGFHRHARDQWLRAAQSIPLNIAEGNGKRSAKDRSRFLDIARGSTLECVAIQDVLIATGALDQRTHLDLKRKLHRLVSMLTRLIARLSSTAETSESYVVGEEIRTS